MVFLESGDERLGVSHLADTRMDGLILPFNLFAGLPLKRVVATGIAHPRDQRQNLFF